MTIRYEANPPKILPDINKDESIKKFVEKIKIIERGKMGLKKGLNPK